MTKSTKRPYGDPTSKRRNVTINEQDWKALKELGGGNASAGIRKAVAEYPQDADTGRTSEVQAWSHIDTCANRNKPSTGL